MHVIHRQVAASLGAPTEQYTVERRCGRVPAPPGVGQGYVKKQGVDDALIQPYSGQANRQSYDLVMDTFPI
jgi:hypothetical protein